MASPMEAFIWYWVLWTIIYQINVAIYKIHIRCYGRIAPQRFNDWEILSGRIPTVQHGARAINQFFLFRTAVCGTMYTAEAPSVRCRCCLVTRSPTSRPQPLTVSFLLLLFLLLCFAIRLMCSMRLAVDHLQIATERRRKSRHTPKKRTYACLHVVWLHSVSRH